MAAYAVLAADWMAQYRFATPVWPLAALADGPGRADVLVVGAVAGPGRRRRSPCVAVAGR